MNMKTAREIAARIWGDPDYSHVTMNVEAAEKIARKRGNIMIWENLLTTHHRIMARFLRKRGWVVFYLEEQARTCNEGTCWLKLYQNEMERGE